MEYTFNNGTSTDKWGNETSTFVVDSFNYRLIKLKQDNPKPNKIAAYKIYDDKGGAVRLDIFENVNKTVYRSYVFSDQAGDFFTIRCDDKRSKIVKDELFSFLTEEEKDYIFFKEDLRFFIATVASQLKINEKPHIEE